ncbi:hypothetical protein HKX48_003496, partial [Thoreauomyces humboldtii]
MLPHLGTLIQAVVSGAGGDPQRLEKIEKVLRLWEAKGVFDVAEIEYLKQASILSTLPSESLAQHQLQQQQQQP